MRSRRLLKLIFGVALIFGAGLVHADSCTFKTKLRYSDGQEGCLSELPIAAQTSKVWGKSIENVALYSTNYMIVAASSCSNAEIFATSQNILLPYIKNTMASQANSYIEACPKECDCTVVVNNGNVLLPKNLALALGRAESRIAIATNQVKEQELKNAERLLAQEAQRKEKALLDEQAKKREQLLLAEAEALRSQRKFEEEARVKEQLRLAQENKAKEDERLARELAEKERVRLAEAQRNNALAQADQEERRKDRELLQQLSAELSRLRAEAAAAAVLAQANAAAAVATKVTAPKTTADEPMLAPEPIYANRKALVIGNDNYKSVTKLENAREDARLMAKSLGNVGYQVTLKLDVSEKEMKTALRGFKNQVEAGDEVAIFYAGHGVQLANSNYLIPIDVAGQDEDQLKDEGIALQRLLDDMADKKVKFTLAMIDACRDNPFKSNGRAIGGGTRGLAPTTAATGQMIVFSAGSGQQALDKLSPDDKDKNGLFTRIFAREMQKPNTSIDRVVRTVRAEVVKLARSVGHDQVPSIYDQVVGEFYFRK